MKPWYQSVSRQTEWGGYPALSRTIPDKVKDPGTEIHVDGITRIEMFREHHGHGIRPTVTAS